MFTNYPCTCCSSLVPSPLPTQEEGSGAHRLRMCKIISRFSIKLFVYYSLPRGHPTFVQADPRISLFVFAGLPTAQTNSLSSHHMFVGHTRAYRARWRNHKYFMGIYDVPRFWVQTGACAVGVYQALLPALGGAWGRGYCCRGLQRDCNHTCTNWVSRLQSYRVIWAIMYAWVTFNSAAVYLQTSVQDKLPWLS